MRLRVVPLISIALVLTACGGGGGSITIASPSASDTFDKDLCTEFEAEDGPSEKLIAGLPDRFDGTTAAIKDFGAAMEAMGDNDESSIDGIAKLLTTARLGSELKDLAQFAEQQCGESEGSKTIAALGMAADVASADADAAYCAALEEQFAAGGDATGSDTTTAENLAALSKVAPESHQAALDLLGSLGSDEGSSAQTEAFGALMGIGVYAEKACKIDGALAQMLLGAMFVGLGDSTTSTDPTGSDTPAPDVDPTTVPAADASAANDALPSGSGLTFEVTPGDLDDDHQHLAAMVVPVGWTASSGFDLTFSPSADSGASIFTSIEAGAGCDGMCEPTDWDARLRGESGALASFVANHPSAAEAPITGSEGAVLTTTTDGVAALVLRWDDAVDKYFKCEVSLEDDQAALLPAFVAACESSRPAWFPVS